MMNSADARRRWLGLFFLALASGMLIWGQTVLQDRLDGMTYLVYWAFCFLFTMAAVVVATLHGILLMDVVDPGSGSDPAFRKELAAMLTRAVSPG